MDLSYCFGKTPPCDSFILDKPLAAGTEESPSAVRTCKLCFLFHFSPLSYFLCLFFRFHSFSRFFFIVAVIFLESNRKMMSSRYFEKEKRKQKKMHQVKKRRNEPRFAALICQRRFFPFAFHFFLSPELFIFTTLFFSDTQIDELSVFLRKLFGPLTSKWPSTQFLGEGRGSDGRNFARKNECSNGMNRRWGFVGGWG